MSLPLLFEDELRGFYRSKVMTVLWIGLPALAGFLYYLSPDTAGIPFAAFAGLIVSSIGGVLASVMLTTSILNERSRHVYDLFVVRPVRRRDILLAKFLAVYGCVVLAGALALALGIGIDYGLRGTPPAVGPTLSFLGIMLGMLAVSCSAGVLIGVAAPSVLVGVILVVYGGNQLSAVVILPVLTLSSEPWFPLLPGAGISAALLALAVVLFDRKAL